MTDFIGYIADYQIRTNEIDINKRLKPSSILQLMQETSMQNVLDLKVSVWDLEKENLSWILLKKHLQIEKSPVFGDSIRVKTYPAGFDRILAYRDFIMYDQQNEILATASSIWGLMDLQSKKMIKIPHYDFYNHLPDKLLERPSFSLHHLKKIDRSIEKHVTWNDIDWNGHVNNISTIKLLLDAAPRSDVAYQTLDSLSVQFKNESYLKDHLISECQIEGKTIKHQIKRNGDNKIIALAKSLWK